MLNLIVWHPLALRPPEIKAEGAMDGIEYLIVDGMYDLSELLGKLQVMSWGFHFNPYGPKATHSGKCHFSVQSTVHHAFA